LEKKTMSVVVVMKVRRMMQRRPSSTTPQRADKMAMAKILMLERAAYTWIRSERRR
jgi:hypothetical protein